MERENEKLRADLLSGKVGDRGASTGMKDMLTESRQELEQHRISMAQVNQEVIKLRAKVGELQVKLAEEHNDALRNEALANEYSVQIQELRHLLTNDRYEQARAKDDENRYPTF